MNSIAVEASQHPWQPADIEDRDCRHATWNIQNEVDRIFRATAA